MNAQQTQILPSELEACKQLGVVDYPKLGVLSKFILGIDESPKLPQVVNNNRYLQVQLCDGNTLQEALDNTKSNILGELKTYNVKEDDITYVNLETDWDGDIEVGFSVKPTQNDFDNFNCEQEVYEEMRDLLHKVLHLAKDLTHLDKEQTELKRRADIEAQIATLQKLL